MKKRILSIVLCLSMFVATFATTMVVSAAEVNAETGYCADISDYRAEGNFTAPTKEGKVFAGWYEDADFTTAIAPSVKSGVAYAKFVDPTVFSVKNQFNEGAHKKSATVDLRIITTIDSEWFADIEFTFTAQDFGTVTLPIDTVYTSLVNYESASEAFCSDSAYFAVEKITGIPAEVFAKELSITPKFTTYDGTVFEGTTRGTEEEPLTLSANLALKQTIVSAIRDDSDKSWIVLNWQEDVDMIANPAVWGYEADGWSWAENSGVYYNGQKTWAKLTKNGCHYMLLQTDMGLNIIDGDTISVQGICMLNGEAVIDFAPITAQYNGETGKWEVISRETVVAPTEATLSWNASRTDKNTLFFNSNLAVEHPAVQTGWNNVYVDDKAVSLNIVRYGATNYYFELYSNVITINVGSKLVVQGPITVGSSTLTVKPVTFQCVAQDENGWTWEIVSRKEYEYIPTVTLSFTGGDRCDNKALFFTISPSDALYYTGVFTYWTDWAEIYRNGERLSGARMYKFAANQYYISFTDSGLGEQEVGTTITIQGMLTDEHVLPAGSEKGVSKVKFSPTTFTLREGGVWEITSTELFVPAE